MRTKSAHLSGRASSGKIAYEDALELVDAVDGADVDAGEVFDVDAGLGDDVRHRRTPPSRRPRVGLAPVPSVFLTLCRPSMRRSISSGIV
jgi:hypothetical protein